MTARRRDAALARAVAPRRAARGGWGDGTGTHGLSGTWAERTPRRGDEYHRRVDHPDPAARRDPASPEPAG